MRFPKKSFQSSLVSCARRKFQRPQRRGRALRTGRHSREGMHIFQQVRAEVPGAATLYVDAAPTIACEHQQQVRWSTCRQCLSRPVHGVDDSLCRRVDYPLQLVRTAVFRLHCFTDPSDTRLASRFHGSQSRVSLFFTNFAQGLRWFWSDGEPAQPWLKRRQHRELSLLHSAPNTAEPTREPFELDVARIGDGLSSIERT